MQSQLNKISTIGLVFASTMISSRRAMNTFLTRCFHMSLVGVLCVGLLACGEENISDLDDYINSVKKREKSSVPPLPEVKEFETYSYVQTKLRDPFERQLSSGDSSSSRRASGIRPDLKRKLEVLEQFPLDTLSMVGSLEQSGERWALIKGQDGTIYRAKKGNYLGQDNGQILSISDTQVELLEIVPDGLGGWVKRKSTLSAN